MPDIGRDRLRGVRSAANRDARSHSDTELCFDNPFRESARDERRGRIERAGGQKSPEHRPVDLQRGLRDTVRASNLVADCRIVGACDEPRYYGVLHGVRGMQVHRSGGWRKVNHDVLAAAVVEQKVSSLSYVHCDHNVTAIGS